MFNKLPVFNNKIYNTQERNFSVYNLSNIKNKFINPLNYILFPESFLGRFDLASQALYGTPRYWWLLISINDITDPFDPDLVGTRLGYPDRLDLVRALDSLPG